ncbi:MBL fold metallo-hydrolase [Nocardia vinacea]|uniref:MBL fold metallo-hydrolase n=1 Tax=Nocardia vinacea TaxID=96468 RepID=A0ABZ1YW34_9NOCA|nr:MBL fold metallo-hydrolase [Nocardia vinacea]
MPLVADQPEDWTEPGAHQVARGIHRVPLPLPLDGLGTVNAYVLEATDGLVVIDPGWYGPQTETAMTVALRRLGYRLDDIVTCLATHHHWDHYSQAYAWRSTLGCELFVGREERHSILSFHTDAGRFPNHAQLLARCGAPELAREIAHTPAPENEVGVSFGPPDRWLEHGDRIQLRDGQIEVIATPGHTRGHVVFHHTDSRVLFSGDHILPHITPSIGLEWAPEPHPLRSYITSLELVHGLPDAAVLPSHGPVTISSHSRIEELLRHHRRRLDEICDEVAAGSSTAYTVARALRWTRRNRQLDELPIDHQLSAVTEIHAHLDVLAMLGRVSYIDQSNVRTYALSA